MNQRTGRISLEDLSAFLDGELAPEQAAEVAEFVLLDRALLERLENYHTQTVKLHALYDSLLCDPPPDRLLAILRRFNKST